VNRLRELAALLDEVATIDWRHPSWWATIAAVAAFERWPLGAGRDVDTDYLSSDGGPRADTFMATPQVVADAASAIAAAVTQARAAWDALVELDGTLPGQPLLCQLDRRAALVRRRPLGQPRRVAFATPTGVYVATLESTPSGDGAVVDALAAVYRGEPAPRLLERVDPLGDRSLDAAIGVSLMLEDPSTGRHVHRRVWTRAGGPWLGLGRTADLSLVTTSHMVVDGYGHALIAARVLAAPLVETLSARARRRLGDVPLEPGPALAEALPLGVATCALGEPARFVELLHATAATLERVYRRQLSPRQRAAAAFAPTLQVPIAPGERDDPLRLRRRVAPGLVSVRMSEGQLEHPRALQARLGALIAREAACAGVLSRVREAARRMPLPAAVKRRSLQAGAVPHPLAPPIEVLAGRGCLSSLACSPDDTPRMPLVAVSAPALDPSIGDPRGGSVLTVVQHEGGTTVTVSGTGVAGTRAGAAAFLGEWRAALARARALTAAAGALPETG
jgi:hypothetical protein